MTAPTPNPDTTDAAPLSPPRRRRRRRWITVSVVGTIALAAVVLLWFQPQTLLFDRVVEDEFPTVAPPSEPADIDDPDAVAAPDPAPSDGEEPASERSQTSPDEGSTSAPERDAAAADEGTATDAGAATDEGTATGEETATGEPHRDEADTGDGGASSPSVEEPVQLATGSFGSRNRYTVTGGVSTYELADASRVLRLEGFESTNGPDLFVYLTVGDASEPSDDALAAEYVDLGVLRGNVGDQNYAIPADVDLARFDTVVIWCRRFASAFGAADLR